MHSSRVSPSIKKKWFSAQPSLPLRVKDLHPIASLPQLILSHHQNPMPRRRAHTTLRHPSMLSILCQNIWRQATSNASSLADGAFVQLHSCLLTHAFTHFSHSLLPSCTYGTCWSRPLLQFRMQKFCSSSFLAADPWPHSPWQQYNCFPLQNWYHMLSFALHNCTSPESPVL